MVTSRPSRIHVMPSETTTSQCHRLQGRRSNLAGILVLTAFALSPMLLFIAFIAPSLLCSIFTAVSIGRIYHFVKYLYYLIYYLYELKIFLYREEVLRELQVSSRTALLKSRHMCSPPHPKREKEREAGDRGPRLTLFLSFFGCRRRPVLADQC